MREKEDIKIWAGGDWRSLKNAKIWAEGAWRDFGCGNSGAAIWADGDWNRIRSDYRAVHMVASSNAVQQRPNVTMLDNVIIWSFGQMYWTWSNKPSDTIHFIQFLKPQDLLNAQGYMKQVTLRGRNFTDQVHFEMKLVLLDFDYRDWTPTCYSTIKAKVLEYPMPVTLPAATVLYQYYEYDITAVFTGFYGDTVTLCGWNPSITNYWQACFFSPCEIWLDGERYI
ncbi:MAG: hypothetical protein LBG92_03045 [Prevotellaceae bacterium]|jgi:hypothetical protein|nr:hypothetical protein [Prevotellaceae bacterium]